MAWFRRRSSRLTDSGAGSAIPYYTSTDSGGGSRDDFRPGDVVESSSGGFFSGFFGGGDPGGGSDSGGSDSGGSDSGGSDGGGGGD